MPIKSTTKLMKYVKHINHLVRRLKSNYLFSTSLLMGSHRGLTLKTPTPANRLTHTHVQTYSPKHTVFQQSETEKLSSISLTFCSVIIIVLY